MTSALRRPICTVNVPVGVQEGKLYLLVQKQSQEAHGFVTSSFRHSGEESCHARMPQVVKCPFDVKFDKERVLVCDSSQGDHVLCSKERFDRLAAADSTKLAIERGPVRRKALHEDAGI